MSWEKKKNISGMLFLIPITFFELVFIIVPLLNIVWYSFHDMSGYDPSAGVVGLDNFNIFPSSDGVGDIVCAS